MAFAFMSFRLALEVGEPEAIHVGYLQLYRIVWILILNQPTVVDLDTNQPLSKGMYVCMHSHRTIGNT